MNYSSNIPKFYVFSGFAYFMIWIPIWVVFLERRGISLGQIGALELLAWTLMAGAEVPTGAIADMWGREASLVLGAFLHGLALLGLLTGVLSPIFILAYAIWGVSMTFFSGAAEALIFDSLKADGQEERFTHVMSRSSMIVQGSMAGSALVGGLIAAWDMRLCFVISAICSFAAVAAALRFHEPPAGDAVGSGLASYVGSITTGVKVAAGQLQVRYVILVGATLNLFAMLLTINAFQPYAREVEVPTWPFGGIVFGIRLAGMAGAYLAPHAAQRMRREQLVAIASFGIVGIQMLLWLGASRPAVGLFAMVALVMSVVRPSLSAMLNELIPSQQRATILSLQSLIMMLGMGLVQAGLFALGERTTLAFALGMSAITMAVIIGPMLALLFHSLPTSDVSIEPLAQ